MEKIFDEIRTRCARVAGTARSVLLRYDRISSYAAGLPLDHLAAPELDPRHHVLGRGEETLLFILTLDSINFGSGYFPRLQKLPGLSGYFTVATRLTKRFHATGPLLPAEMATLSGADCATIFCQDRADPARAELMDLFASALRDLGTLLLETYGGSATRLVESAGGQASELVRLLAQMPFFRDVQRYGELEVPLYKRAQLTAADLALAFAGDGWGRFDDLAQLTIFADNLVPHVLRLDGLLEYDHALLEAITVGELIPAGSAQEVEIRAMALHAVELIVRTLSGTGRAVTAMQLDYLLWNRGQQPAYKAHPRHRTRTVFY